MPTRISSWHVAILIAAAAIPNGWAGPAASETIEAALARAYQNNPQLNAQRAVVRKTDEGVPQALSGYRPHINANASVGKLYTDAQLTTGGLTSSITAPFNTWSVGANATQNLFNAQTPNRTRAAESQVFAARETLRVMEQSVLLSAARVYMDVLRDEANLQLQRDNVRVLRQTLTVAQDNFLAGLVTTTDVDQAQARLAFGEAALHAAESALLTTKANYRRIIGTIPDRLSPGAPVDRFLPHRLEAAVAQSLSRNPLVTAAMYNVDVAQLEVKIAEAGLYPTVVLQGAVQVLELTSNDASIRLLNTPLAQNDASLKLLNSTVQASLTVPIYQGGREYSAIRQSKEGVGQHRLSLDQVRDEVRANVLQYWGQLEAVKAQLEAAHRQVTYSESALNGVREEARTGQRTTLDVLNAIQTLLSARVNLVTAQRDRVVTSYNLLSAVGLLSANVLRLPVRLYDPMVHYQQVRDAWFGVRTPDGR